MKGFLLLLVCLFVSELVSAQCADDVQKLLPDYAGQKSLNGAIVVSGGNYFAVGLGTSDTTGHLVSGGVFLYERSGTSWQYLALLKCSNPFYGGFFGQSISVDSTGQTIAVASRGQTPEIYIFSKPAGGWVDATETEKFSLPSGISIINGVAISKDALTLAVAGSNGADQLLVYERNSITDNFSSVTPASLPIPGGLFATGAFARVTKKYIGVSFDASSNGSGPSGALVYKRNKSLNYPQVAVLKTTVPESFHATLDMSDNLISVGGHILNYSSNGYDEVITAFAKKKSDEWSNTTPGIVLKMNDSNETTIIDYYTPVANINDSTIAISYQYTDFPYPNLPPPYGTIRVASRAGASWNSFTKKEIFHEQTPIPAFYEPIVTSITWNGAQLIAPQTLNSPGSNFLSSITSITMDASGVWGNQSKVKLPGLNSMLFQFGNTVVRTGNNLLVGSPGDDEVGPNAGAVVIYGLNAAKQWTKKSKILPNFIWGAMNFGTSMACSDSILAVSGNAYGTLTVSHTLNAKISLYKRTGADWSSHTTYQDIIPPGNVQSFGEEISISPNLLVSSGYDLDAGKSLFIYTRTASGYSFRQRFQFPTSFGTTHGFQTKIRSDTIFVFSGYLGYQIRPFGAILTKDFSGKYTVSSTLSFPTIDLQVGQADMENINIEVAKDQIFIGLPVAFVDGNPSAGAVVVYSKSGGDVWPAGEIMPTSIITPPDKTPYGYFGASLGNSGGTILVGAPGIDHNSINDGYAFAAPGAAYAFAANDTRWTSSHLLYKFQGDTPSTGDSDKFGYAVDSDAGNYYIGAYEENSFKGAQGGAVYVFRQPPTLQLVGPLCIGTTTPVTLHANPEGGTWAGAGIIDAKNGIFDQNSLPPGNHEVFYYTSDCSYRVSVFIQTLAAINVNVTTPLNIILCPGKKSAISVQPGAGYSYEWYFEPVGASNFAIVPGESAPTLMVDLPGLYYCKVSNGVCTSNSINVQAGIDQPIPTIGPQLILCHSTQSLSLLASQPGGTWSGGNVSGNSFNAVNLANGKYPVAYTVVSAAGCQYVLNDTVQIKAIPALSITRTGEYCKTGNFTLSVKPTDAAWTYTWSYGSTSLDFNVIDTAVNSKETFSADGFYKTFVTNGVCTGETDPIAVSINSSINISVSPADSVINLCNGGSVLLTAQGPDGTEFTWQKSNSRTGTPGDAGEGTSIEITDKGFYNVKGVLGFCKAETPLQRVNILPSDSLKVANVFSPNGDEFNNTFISQGNVNTIFALIVNRWGEEVYRSDTLDWSGQGQPPGVYFWTVTYRDCKLEEKRAKGFVQLIR